MLPAGDWAGYGYPDSNFVRGGNKLKPSTENEITGKVHEVKGAIKEKVGQLTNDPDLDGEDTGEKIDGKVQKKIGPYPGDQGMPRSSHQ